MLLTTPATRSGCVMANTYDTCDRCQRLYHGSGNPKPSWLKRLKLPSPLIENWLWRYMPRPAGFCLTAVGSPPTAVIAPPNPMNRAVPDMLSSDTATI